MIAKLLILLNGYSGFRYGNLETLYPTATPEEITTIRQFNFALFSSLVNDNLDGTPKTINSGRLEMHYDSGTQFNISNGQTLNLTNNAEIICYPIVRNAGSTLFNINTGGEININGAGSFEYDRYPNKSEVYNCILNFGGNKKVIKLTTVPRAGFLTSIVGQVIYVSSGIQTVSIPRTVVSVAGDQITVNTDIDVPADTNDFYTNIAYKFPLDISVADYDAYSGDWWNDYSYIDYFLYCIPLVAEPNPARIHIANNLSKFGHIINISAENFHLTFGANVTLSDTILACSAYSQSVYNLQSVDFNTVNINNCGVRILGGNGGGGQPITAQNILGSGFYIHPSIIVNGTTINVQSCIAAAWRWYGFDAAITKGYLNNVQNFNSTGTNTEYVLRTSETEETTINNIAAQDDFIYLNQGTFNVVETGSVIFFDDGIVTVGTPLATVNQLTTKFLRVFDKNNVGGQNLLVHDLRVKSLYNNDYNSFNANLKRTVTINTLTVLSYTGWGNFSLGGVESGNVFNAIVNPFVDISQSDVTIIGATIAAKAGIFIGFTSPGLLNYNSRVLVKDSSIACSRLISNTSSEGLFRHMVTFENCIIYSIAGGQGNNSRFARYVFLIKPLITNVVKAPVGGSLEFEMQNEITINGGGTIRKLLPYSYDSQGTKIHTTNYFVGSVTIHAVAGNVILEGYDVHSDSNIAVSQTILAGNSLVLTCNTDNVRGTLTPGATSITPTTGATQYTIKLPYTGLPCVPDTLTTSFGVINLSGSEVIANINVNGFWDKVNRIIRLDFPVAPTGNITLGYSEWSAVTALGTWN